MPGALVWTQFPTLCSSWIETVLHCSDPSETWFSLKLTVGKAGPGPLPPDPGAAAEDSPGCSPGLHPSVAGAQLVNPEKANLGGRRMLRARRRTAQPWLPFLETQANLSSRGGVVTSWGGKASFLHLQCGASEK